MKRICVSLIVYFIALQLFAQVQVSRDYGISKTPGSHKKEMMEILKNSKTYFVYLESDIEHLDELKRELSSVWTFNTLEFVHIDKRDEVINIKDVAVFCPQRIETNETFHESNTMRVKSSYTYYNSFIELSLNLGEKRYPIARIELQDVNYAKVEDMGKLPYANWSVPLLKAYLFNINNELSNGTTCGFQDIIKKGGMKELDEGTLIIPEELMGPDTAKELMTDYSSKYEVMPSGAIQAFIKNSEKPVFIACFLITPKDKCATIYNAKTGEMVYNSYTTMSREFKEKDFYRIEIAVRHAVKEAQE